MYAWSIQKRKYVLNLRFKRIYFVSSTEKQKSVDEQTT